MRSSPFLGLSRLVVILLAAAPALAEDDPHARAKSIYAASCASCHGADLRGGGASSLADGLWLYGSGSQIRRNIREGIPEAGMPAYGDALSDADFRALAAYMQAVQQEVTPEPPPLPTLIPTRDYDLRVTPFATGLATPWAIAFPDPTSADTALITERPGRLRIVTHGKLHPKPIAGTPAVATVGQGGLLDVVVDPDYANNGWIYLSYSHATKPAAKGQRPHAMTRVVRGRIRDHTWTDQEVLFEARPEHYVQPRVHFGTRFAFDPEGHLYFSIGDRGKGSSAQNLELPNGKIHRIHRDGSIPADNPFVSGHGNAYPSIFTYGNRNPQGLATHPVTGQIWSTEHGPLGGDELNLLKSGVNYGWPEISYGQNYSGTVMTEFTANWKPSIAVCGLTFYTGQQFPRWRNNLFAGGLSYETVRRLVVVDQRVIYQEELLKNLGRVRDVQEGPDGAIYVVLNSPDTVIRLSHDATHHGAGDGNEVNP